MHVRRSQHRGFTLVELAMVVATMAFIAGIAVPRLARASERAQASALAASTRTLKFAIELYAAEHNERTPFENADGSAVTDPAVVISRLTKKSDEFGAVSAAGTFGPYLKEWPANPVNGKRTLRFGNAAAGTHGWYLASGGRIIQPDKGGGGALATELTAVAIDE